MRILPLDPSDAGTVRACHEIHAAAVRADDSPEPTRSVTAFRTRLTRSRSGSRTQVWFMPGAKAGTVAAWCRAELSTQENQNLALLDLVVDPARRRGGLGTALLRHAAGEAAADGRGCLRGTVQEGSAGEAFARQAGATQGMTDIRRVLELRAIPAGAVASLRESGEKAAAGYSLVRWEGLTPDARLDQVAALRNALNDAPRDASVEGSAWDARRVREHADAYVARSGMRRYSLAAVHDASGEMAALTMLSVDPGVPDWGLQAFTAVARPHRGHRLGLLVKAAMMEWLMAAEPRLERILTENASSNRHMIAINEELGYQVWGRPFRTVEIPVASVVKP